MTISEIRQTGADIACEKFMRDASKYVSPEYIKDQQIRREAERSLSQGAGITFEKYMNVDAPNLWTTTSPTYKYGKHIDRDCIGILLSAGIMSDDTWNLSFASSGGVVTMDGTSVSIVYQPTTKYSLSEEDRREFRLPVPAAAIRTVNTTLERQLHEVIDANRPVFVPPLHRVRWGFRSPSVGKRWGKSESWLIIRGLGYYWSRSNSTWILSVLKSVLADLVLLS